MGFMTNITILNDHWSWIEDNPETFVAAIKYGMTSGSDEEIQDREFFHRIEEVEAASRHYVTVHKAEHADMSQIIYSQANSAYPVHQLAWGSNTLRNWVNRWGEESSNAGVRTGIMRSVIRDLREQADRLEDKLNDLEKERDV